MSHTSKIYSNTVIGKVNHPKENVNARISNHPNKQLGTQINVPFGSHQFPKFLQQPRF